MGSKVYKGLGLKLKGGHRIVYWWSQTSTCNLTIVVWCAHDNPHVLFYCNSAIVISVSVVL